MSPARALLAILGIGIAVVGIAVALWFDRFAGMAVLVVGAFLIILPFTGFRDEE